MKKRLVRKILWTLLYGKLQNQVRFLGIALGDLDVQAGISSVRLCQRRFWVILSIFTVVELTLSFHTTPTKLPSQKPRQVRPLPTTGCTMVLSTLTMSRCPSPWVTLSPCMMPSRPLMAKCFVSSLRLSITANRSTLRKRLCMMPRPISSISRTLMNNHLLEL